MTKKQARERVLELLWARLARRKNRGEAYYLAKLLWDRHADDYEKPFPVVRLTLATWDIGLTADEIRGAIRTLRQVGFLFLVGKLERSKNSERSKWRAVNLFKVGTDFAISFLAESFSPTHKGNARFQNKAPHDGEIGTRHRQRYSDPMLEAAICRFAKLMEARGAVERRRVASGTFIP